MARGVAIDRHKLHRDLFEQSDRLGRLEIYQKQLAERMGITQATMSLVIKELVTEGRIRKIASRRRNVGIYVIYDPATFPHVFEDYTVPGIGIERCRVCGQMFEGGPHYPKEAK